MTAVTIISWLIIGIAVYVIIQFAIGSFQYKFEKIALVVIGIIIAFGVLIFSDVLNYVIVKSLAVLGSLLLILIYLIIYNNLFDKD